jgi:hypothetical protein
MHGEWAHDFQFFPATLGDMNSLAENCRRPAANRDSFETASDIAQLMLTGRHPDTGKVASINVLADAITDDEVDTFVRQHRDYDSLIGISRSLCARGDLAIYPVPRFEETIKKPIHIPFKHPLHPDKVSSVLLLSLRVSSISSIAFEGRGPPQDSEYLSGQDLQPAPDQPVLPRTL